MSQGLVSPFHSHPVSAVNSISLPSTSYCPHARIGSSTRAMLATSAELTSGCHLNLCHLCAPLLLLREHRDDTAAITVTSPQVSGDGSPCALRGNQILARATANHPKSRRLSMGGTQPMQAVMEFGPESLCPAQMPSVPSDTRLPSTEVTIDGNGRISPSRRVAEEGRGAKCVMCRAQVSGWLRVYPG